MADTRDKNQYFSVDSIKDYLGQYSRAITAALSTVDPEQLEHAYQYLDETVKLRGRVFVGGNGGSAAISDHLTCDILKGTCTEHVKPPKVHSLVSCTPLYTAIANDLGYDQTLVFQLKALDLDETDTVILISSSGNSPNIIEAANYAYAAGAALIGMTGFDGGKLKDLSDASLHVGFNNYGIIEDCHQILMHILAQYRYLKTNE